MPDFVVAISVGVMAAIAGWKACEIRPEERLKRAYLCGRLDAVREINCMVEEKTHGDEVDK